MRVVGGVLGRGVRWGGGRAEWREWPAEVPRLSGRRAGHRHWGSPAHSGSGQCHLASFPYSTRLLLAAAGPGGEETGGSRVELGAAGGARRAGGRRGRSQGGGRPHEVGLPAPFLGDHSPRPRGTCLGVWAVEEAWHPGVGPAGWRRGWGVGPGVSGGELVWLPACLPGLELGAVCFD